ncbi:hypothetical protein D3C76_1524960 [compost metagenome]
MQTVELMEAGIQCILREIGDFLVLLSAGFMVHEPHHTAPKSIRPPVDIFFDLIVVRAISCRVWNFVS